MSRVINIEIRLPEDVEFTVSERPEHNEDAPTVPPNQGDVERYFRHYLSDNGRKVFAVAARIEENQGPGYTLSDIAANLSLEYGSVKSYLITSGRSARRWKDETGTEAPIQFEGLSYDWVQEERGRRAGYRLPTGVAEIVARLH